MMRKLIFILAVVLAVPAAGQRRKSDAGTVPVIMEGITYALPRTGLRIQVEALKETFEPGPYASFASQLLGIPDARNRPSVKWTITDVHFDTFSEPDPEQVFKAMGNGAFLIDLTASGCLAGVNSGSPATSASAPRTFSQVGETIKNDGFSFANTQHSSISGRIDTVRRSGRSYIDEKPAEAAKRILECRTNRYLIVAGLMDEFHPDGESYKVSLRELERIENEYMSLFVGRTTYQTHRSGFNFVPTSASEKGEVVFRFSEENGVLPASNLAGKPVMIRVDPEKTLVSKYAGLSTSANPQAGQSGIFYRMPAVADISFIYEMNPILTSRTLLPQFGQVAPIPEELLMGGYSIEIHSETGAVKSVYKK